MFLPEPFTVQTPLQQATFVPAQFFTEQEQLLTMLLGVMQLVLQTPPTVQ
jgi:hypothetical protein